MRWATSSSFSRAAFRSARGAARGRPPGAGDPCGTQGRIDAASVRAAEGLDTFLPRRTDSILRALASRFEPSRAMDLVSFMDRFWRVPGNSGYNASLERIRSGLTAAGFAEAKGPGASSPSLWFEEYPNGGNGWEPVSFAMTILEGEAGPAERVFDPVIDYIALCMNSFPTPPGGLTRASYTSATETSPRTTPRWTSGSRRPGGRRYAARWQEAVGPGRRRRRLAERPPDYARPDETPEIFQWGGIPCEREGAGLRVQGEPEGGGPAERAAEERAGDRQGRDRDEVRPLAGPDAGRRIPGATGLPSGS